MPIYKVYTELTLASIKDIVTIAFYIIGAVIAILTYLRAKATILQPKRTELVKKQTEIFSNFLSFINENENSIDDSFDYVSLFSNNIDLVLRDFGLLEISKTSEKIIEFNNNISGWIQFLENDFKKFVFIRGDLNDYDNQIFEKNNRERQKFYKKTLEDDSFEVHRIFYTKKYEKSYKTIRAFSTNPFLPSNVQKLAYKIGQDLHENVHVVLKLILKNLIIEYYNALNDKPNSMKIVLIEEYRHQELFRIFEQERINHDKAFDELKILIREHLNIDEEW